MRLKYVGAYPIVTHKGVAFDPNKPDSYKYLNAVLEIMEAISNKADNEHSIVIDTNRMVDYTPSTLEELLEKYCDNLDEMLNIQDKKTKETISKYEEGAKNNPNLNSDEKSAILGNINIMKDYYRQYITNEVAYECALQALSKLIHEKKIDDITFSVGRNYGLVLTHLAQVLQDSKPPYDATMEFFSDEKGEAYGKLDMNRHKH
jgi:hypothetical protein